MKLIFNEDCRITFLNFLAETKSYPLKRSARQSLAPLQKSHPNSYVPLCVNRSIVSSMDFVPVQKLSVARTVPKATFTHSWCFMPLKNLWRKFTSHEERFFKIVWLIAHYGGPQLSRQTENLTAIPHSKTKRLTAKTKYLTAKPNISQQKPNTSRQKQIPTAKPKLFCFCCEVFGFAVRFLVLPWGILFLPWGVWFCREVFCFCREVFGFCRKVFGFAVTVVGHHRLFKVDTTKNINSILRACVKNSFCAYLLHFQVYA